MTGLATKGWNYIQNYAHAKTEVTNEMVERARPAG